MILFIYRRRLLFDGNNMFNIFPSFTFRDIFYSITMLTPPGCPPQPIDNGCLQIAPLYFSHMIPMSYNGG